MITANEARTISEGLNFERTIQNAAHKGATSVDLKFPNLIEATAARMQLEAAGFRCNRNVTISHFNGPVVFTVRW